MKKYLLLTLLFPSLLFSQSYDALFIGNSYTFYNNMPTLVSEIALSLGDTLNVESNTPAGTNFQTHAAANSSSMQAIRQKPWDFVILQAQSQEPSFSPEQVQVQTYPFAATLVDSILENDSCTEPMFFMTWGRKNGDAQNAAFYPQIATYLGMQQRLRESYLEMGFDNEASVSPVGMAWKRSIAENPDFELYNADESHPNLAGSYLTACVFYASIFGESCVGSTYYPNGITEEEAANLQQIASETVLDSTAVWNLFAIQEASAIWISTIYDFDVEASNYDSLHWDFGDGNTSNEATVSHEYSNSSEFLATLSVYGNNGCKVITQDFPISTLDVSIVNEFYNSIAIRPNPTSGFLQIESNDSFKAKIYNVLGELIKDMDNESIVDMTSFPNGNYVLQIHTVSEMKHFNIIKK